MKTKKLLVAVCLLLISATLLGSASFAWFSMNTQVDVEGIEVEAYSDSLFLEISKTSKDATDFSTSVSFAGEEKMLRLAKHGFVANAYTLVVSAGSGYYSTGNSTTYYKLIEETVDSYKKYVKVDSATEFEVGTNVKGLYKDITFTLQLQGAVADTATYSYFELDGGKYTPVTVTNGDDVKGLYALGTTVSAIATDSYYDGSAGTYYKSESGSYYNVTSTLVTGTDLSAYYTVTATPVTVAGDGTAKVTGDVYLASTGDAADEYAFYANYAAETDIAAELAGNTLYFGRAYSDVIDDGDKTDTLSIIKAASLNSYRYQNTVWLRNANNTNTSENLKAEFTIGGKDNALKGAIRVLLYITDAESGNFVNVVYYDGTTTYGLDGTDDNIVDRLLGDEQETLKVDIFVYFDGTDADADNENVEAGVLDGQTVDIKFTIADHPYNEAP